MQSWIRDKAELIEVMNSGIIPEFMFFFGIQNTSKDEINESCLSQWYPTSFQKEDLMFISAEQYMMYCKARLFSDQESMQAILDATSPKEAKALGRKVCRFDPIIWDKFKFEIVCEGNWLKFSQNLELYKFLAATNDKVLAEASPYDRIWGIGLPKDHIDVNDPTKWQGENLLGFALMQVRHILTRPMGIVESMSIRRGSLTQP